MNESHLNGQGGIVALQNIALAERAVSRLVNRGPTEPGMAVMCGPSGYGKSMSAARITARHRAYYVEADDFWTKKTMLHAISRAMGLAVTKGTAYELANGIKEELGKSQRILIIDEFDYLIEKNLVEAVRSIYEGSKASILLIGEEALPQKLAKWERFHGRVLDWFFAEPVSLNDARELAKQRCPGIAVNDGLLAHLVEIAEGSVRRVSNNLGLIYMAAASNAWQSVDLKAWDDRKLQRGKAPRRGEK